MLRVLSRVNIEGAGRTRAAVDCPKRQEPFCRGLFDVRGPSPQAGALAYPLEGARGREVAPEGGPGPRGGRWRWPEAEVSKVLDCLASALFLTPFW